MAPITGDEWNILSKSGKSTIESSGTMQAKIPHRSTTVITKKPVLVEGSVATLEAGGWHDRISIGVEGASTPGTCHPSNVIRFELNGFGLVHVGRDIGGNCHEAKNGEGSAETKDHLLEVSEKATGKRLQMRAIRSSASSGSQAGAGWMNYIKSYFFTKPTESLMLQFKVGEDGENQWVDAAAFPTSVMEGADGEANGLRVFLQLYKNKTKTGRLTEPLHINAPGDPCAPSSSTKRPRDEDDTTADEAQGKKSLFSASPKKARRSPKKPKETKDKGPAESPTKKKTSKEETPKSPKRVSSPKKRKMNFV